MNVSKSEEQENNLWQVSGVQNKKKSDDCKISCQKVLDHISNCPICNKFYNNDRTVYISLAE